MLGTGGLFYFIPSLPEVIDAVQTRENIDPDNEILNDKAAGIYNAFYAIGCIIAPILGGILYDSIGYRYANDVIALLGFVFLIAYLVFNTTRSDYTI